MSDISFIEVNGAALRYALSGDGPQTLVLLHELAGNLNSWDDLLTLLPGPLRVLRFDMRGAGMSEKVRGTLDFDTVTDDVAALLDALEIEGKVIVAGAAVGGAIAANFAIRHPQRCERLILIGPALGIPVERRHIALGLADRLDAEGMRAIAAEAFPKAFPEALWQGEKQRKRAEARWLGADPFGYAAAYRMLAHAEIKSRLSAISCPVLALAGRFDPFGTPEIVQNAVNVIPNVRFGVVEGGHFMSVQNPEKVATAIAPFLGEH